MAFTADLARMVPGARPLREAPDRAKAHFISRFGLARFKRAFTEGDHYVAPCPFHTGGAEEPGAIAVYPTPSGAEAVCSTCGSVRGRLV